VPRLGTNPNESETFRRLSLHRCACALECECGARESHCRLRDLQWNSIRGTDPGDVFGQGANLNGQPYSVLYVFDTGSYVDNHPTLNFVFGGTNFGVPSPLVGAAVLTIGGVNIDIGGDKVGEIFGNNLGPGAFSEQLH
jgi:hypothetical protein